LIRAKVLPFPDVGDDGDFQQFSISPIFGNLPCVSFVSFVVSGFAFPIAAMTGAPGKPAFGFLGWDHGDSGDRRASARHPSPTPSIRFQKDLVAFIPGVPSLAIWQPYPTPLGLNYDSKGFNQGHPRLAWV
jgi:hypothetical protein